jgi:hypothetical protein
LTVKEDAPAEIRAALSADAVEALRKLVEAKKTYDEIFSKIIYP